MAGEAQFNTNVWLRGRMVAMTGNFSGTFAADNIEAVSGVNMRNGAVSSYYQTSVSQPADGSRLREIEWVLPAQPQDTIADFTVPIVVAINRDYSQPDFVQVYLYKNGILMSQDPVEYFGLISSRYVDFDILAGQSVTYRMEITRSWNFEAYFKGKIMSAVRRR